MPRAPEEQIARELHELNRTMSSIDRTLKHILSRLILETGDSDKKESQEKQSL